MSADKDIYKVKMVLVGESGVGKTNIARIFKGIDFNEEHLLTSGVDFVVRENSIKHKTIKFFLWDTAGKDFHNPEMMKMLCSGKQAILLVYDITNKKSFDELKKFCIKDIKKAYPNVKCK